MPRRSREPSTAEPQRAGGVETIIALATVVAALYLGRGIAIPIAIAVLISFFLNPAVSWFRRRRFARLPAIAIVVLPALVGLAAFAYVATTEVGRLAENLPAYQTNIEAKIDGLQKALPARDLLDRGTLVFRNWSAHAHREPAGSDETLPSHLRPDSPRRAEGRPVPVEIRNPEPGPVDLLRSVLGPLVEPVAKAGLVLLFVVFFLAEREQLRDRLIRLAGVRDLHRTTMAMDETGRRVSRYLLMQTLVNSVFGLVVAVGLFFVGLPNAALWGVLAAALRFIPYLGVIASSILPLALAFAVDPGWSMVLWTAGLFLALELVVGNLIEPWLYGPSTGLSSVALIVSVIFWTSLWGATGLLLATPLTVCIAVIGRHVHQLEFLGIALGNDIPLKPEESIYQRLLAGDPEEATDQALEFTQANGRSDFLCKVALPALLLAERDRQRGALDDEHTSLVADGLIQVIEDSVDQDDDPDEATILKPSQETPDTVLCVAGRTELDRAAAELLGKLLEEDDCTPMVLPFDLAIRRGPAAWEGRRVRAVCLSYLDADALPQARYLTRRIRRQLGADVCVFVAFWGAASDVETLAFLKGETRADRVVTTLPAAMDAIRQSAQGRDSVVKDAASHLNELARLASSAVERSA